MTRKRFKKLLMGRCGFTRKDADDAASLVVMRERKRGGLCFIFYKLADSYAEEYEDIVNDLGWG